MYCDNNDLCTAGQLDLTGKFSKQVTVKGLAVAALMLLLDENTQVNGVKYLVDVTGFEMGHLTYFGLEDVKNMIRLWTVRKCIHLSE